MFQILKKKLVLRLSEAKTSEDYKNIESVFNYSFTCMVRDMEDFETKVMQNKFRTVKEATNSIANLKEKIKEKIKILEGSESYADY